MNNFDPQSAQDTAIKVEKPLETSPAPVHDKEEQGLNIKRRGRRFLILVLICIACFVFGIIVGRFVLIPDPPNKDSKQNLPVEPIDPFVTVDTVKHVLEPAGELVSGKYRYKNVMTFKEAKQLDLKFKNKKVTLPGTTDEYYIEYEGTIAAGYDLSQAGVDVDDERKSITIQLPKMKILSSTIDWDNIKVRAINDSVFNNTDVKGSITAQKKADVHMREAVAKDAEFENITADSARNVLTALLTTSGDTQGYSVEILFGGEGSEQ